MTLNAVKQTSPAAAKAERDMAQAMRDYENEQCARLANMARLRALRLERERTESKAASAPISVKPMSAKPMSAKKKKAATVSVRAPL
jgi:hypothetical protein